MAVRLVPAGSGEPLAAHATLPDALDPADTLARMAGAKRIESADAESRLALALQYRLLTDATNFIVVHERAEGEKAVDLPELQRVAQMHAAGWGGVGSVGANRDVKISRSMATHVDLRSLDLSLDVVYESLAHMPEECDVVRPTPQSDFEDFGAPAFARCESSDHDQSEALAGLQQVAKILDGQYLGRPRGTLPRSLADLRQLGVDESTLASLAALVAGDVTEEVVVRAFLETLADPAKRAGTSRQLQRALRNQFKTDAEWSIVRAAVAAVVGAPIPSGSPTP